MVVLIREKTESTSKGCADPRSFPAQSGRSALSASFEGAGC
jgi:hypothetical protein